MRGHDIRNCRPIAPLVPGDDPYQNCRVHGTSLPLAKGKHWVYDTGDHDWYVVEDTPAAPGTTLIYITPAKEA